MQDKEFWYELTKTEKRWIENRQWELNEQGYGRDQDFVQKACFEKALEEFKAKNAISNNSG